MSTTRPPDNKPLSQKLSRWFVFSVVLPVIFSLIVILVGGPEDNTRAFFFFILFLSLFVYGIGAAVLMWRQGSAHVA